MAGSTSLEEAFTGSYPSGQRGSYSGASLDRSGSFRESLENRSMSSGPSISKISTSLEIQPLTKILALDPIFINEPKYARLGELRRVLGISLEEHSFGSTQTKSLPPIASEELKRFKENVLESCKKARERARYFQESVPKVDKCRNFLSARKRQRNDLSSSEKSADSNMLKIGGQLHHNSLDVVGQRLEERTKNGVPNKRVRTSMAEIRSEGRTTASMRQGSLVDKEKSLQMEKDKASIRASNGIPTPIDQEKIRGLSTGGDGWEKKLKRKRSVGIMVSRMCEGDRELKATMQQRTASESHTRANDSFGFRSGSFNGITGNNKMDESNLTVSSPRVALKTDSDRMTVANERKELPAVLDKERVIVKGSNKLNVREDSQHTIPSPLTKGKASRQPRTGSGSAGISSSNFPRSVGNIDGWKPSPSLNKVRNFPAVTNRKRLTGSSSPPVSWGGQRPQKMSRTRRTNVVSPMSNFEHMSSLSEGCPSSDATPKMSIEQAGVEISRGKSNNTKQLKLKLENVPSPLGPSESDESGAIENKYKEKEMENGEVEERMLNPVLTQTPTVLSSIKNNRSNMKEETGDGIRRLGRSGRSTLQPKASLSLAKEKLESMDISKPFRNGRLGNDKSESRIGRPPSKKGSDRKSYRSGQITSNGSLDLIGESDDDHGQLLEAANAARNANTAACSSSFWKKMDPLFALVTLEDLDYLKLQINLAEELDKDLPSIIGDSGDQTVLPGPKNLSSFDGTQPVNTVTSGRSEPDRWFERMIPLSQRLLSAFIMEDTIEKFDGSAEHANTSSFAMSHGSPYNASAQVAEEYNSAPRSDVKLEPGINYQKTSFTDGFACNGVAATSNITSSNIHSSFRSDELVHPVASSGSVAFSDSVLVNSDQVWSSVIGSCGASPSDWQYEHLSLDERVLLELNSIGLYAEMVPDLAEGEEEIEKDLRELRVRLDQEVKKKKGQLLKLETSIRNAKETKERNLEQLAMNKLVEIAYKKLVGGRGSHSHNKSGSSKVSKQLAHAFAKRTLARCQEFEETGQSCFSERPLCDIIVSSPIYKGDMKSDEVLRSGFNAENRICGLGHRTSAAYSLDNGLCSSANRDDGGDHRLDRSLFDSCPSHSQVSEQTSVRTGKKREVLLDDVVSIAASRAASTTGHTLPGVAKGKRTDRERDQNKEMSLKGSAKASRTAVNSTVNSTRGERKLKSKLKQKTAQLSSSGNVLLSRVSELSNVSSRQQESCETFESGRISEQVGNGAPDLSKEEDSIFTNLPFHGMDSIAELDVADGLGGQGQDIGSWLGVDEDMQDIDLVGLEIPMDDLSELKLNF